MNKIIVSFLCIVFMCFAACKDEIEIPIELDEELSQELADIAGEEWVKHFTLPFEEELDQVPADKSNPLSAEKVALGKLLFHETGLALEALKEGSLQTYSCASCHFAAAGFQAGRQQGIGEGGLGIGSNGQDRMASPVYLPEELDVQPIRTPAALNTAYQEVMLWNGQFGAVGLNSGTEYAWEIGTPLENNSLGFEGIETQAIAGLETHRILIESFSLFPYGYIDLFDQAFPETPIDERYTPITAGLAIAAYERTLLANQAPWQQWLRGASGAMSDQEKEGAILFFGKAACFNCHSGPALNSLAFHAYGMDDLDSCPLPVHGVLPDDKAHLGRGGFTQRDEEMYQFKVPQLYNLKDSPFYGHGSSFFTIREVVAYKNAGVAENLRVPTAQLSSYFHPLYLTDEEIDAITAFIENALYDPNLNRYQPLTILSGLCFPNNDLQSRVDLGCEEVEQVVLKSGY